LLVTRYLDGRAAADGDAAAIEAALAAAYAEARDAWPGVVLAPESFAAHLGACAGAARGLRALAAVRAHAPELYLACACGAGDRRAISRLEERYLAALGGHLRRFQEGDVVGEALQRLRARLFMASQGQPPRILRYTGEGTLLGWLKVAALRHAIDLTRLQSEDVEPVEAADALVDAAADPELQHIKRRYRNEFRDAVRDSLASLDERERTMLRLYAIDNLNIDEIGRVFGAHRATVARWIAACRAAIGGETRRLLRQRLRITSAELDSLIRLIESDLHASLHDAL
jgi:RNA polymerase sigma-70 factor, ECF subfamily